MLYQSLLTRTLCVPDALHGKTLRPIHKATLQFYAAVKRKEALYSGLCSICDFLNTLTVTITFYIFRVMPQRFFIFSFHTDYYGEKCSPHITLNFQSLQPFWYPEPTADTFPCTQVCPLGQAAAPGLCISTIMYDMFCAHLQLKTKK
jgi:hypothetical protein